MGHARARIHSLERKDTNMKTKSYENMMEEIKEYDWGDCRLLSYREL